MITVQIYLSQFSYFCIRWWYQQSTHDLLIVAVFLGVFRDFLVGTIVQVEPIQVKLFLRGRMSHHSNRIAVKYMRSDGRKA